MSWIFLPFERLAWLRWRIFLFHQMTAEPIHFRRYNDEWLVYQYPRGEIPNLLSGNGLLMEECTFDGCSSIQAGNADTFTPPLTW
jgi:hypothetical protein